MDPRKGRDAIDAPEDAGRRISARFGEAHADQLTRDQRLTDRSNPNAEANANWIWRFHSKFGADPRG